MKTELESSLWDLASSRQGLVTYAEMVAIVGESGLRRLVRRAQVTRLHRGVYRVTGAPVTERQQLLGVVLALGGFASHRSAAVLHDVGGFTLEKPEVLLGSVGTPSRGFADDLTVRIHHTNFLPATHLDLVDGIPCTSLARTLCDLSALRSVDTLEKIIDNCKRRRLVEYDEIATCRVEMKAQGRRRTTVLDEILAARVAGFLLGETPPEDTVIEWVAAAGLVPKPQHWVVANGRRRRLDVAVVDDRIAVEYQGIDAHSTQGAVEHDSEKITDLQLAGWFVVLVTRKTTKAKFFADLKLAVEIQRAARATSYVPPTTDVRNT